MGKSEASNDDLVLDRFLAPFDVVKGERLPRSDSVIDKSLAEIETLLGPESHVEVLPVRVGKASGRDKMWGFFTEMGPFMLVKRLYIPVNWKYSYKIRIWAEKVNHWVPNRMQVFGPFMTRYLNKVAASITLRIFRVNSANSVEGLMDVTDVMNKESQSIWESFFIREMRKLFHHGDIDNILLIVFFLGERINQGRNDYLNWDLVELELRVILNRVSFIQVRSVNKMPSSLKSSSLSLDFISKSGAFNERIWPFMRRHPSVWNWVHLKKFICPL